MIHLVARQLKTIGNSYNPSNFFFCSPFALYASLSVPGFLNCEQKHYHS